LFAKESEASYFVFILLTVTDISGFYVYPVSAKKNVLLVRHKTEWYGLECVGSVVVNLCVPPMQGHATSVHVNVLPFGLVVFQQLSHDQNHQPFELSTSVISIGIL
jgi:hypothetical protein